MGDVSRPIFFEISTCRLSRRKVKHWGYTFDYVNNTIDKTSQRDDIPEIFEKVIHNSVGSDQSVVRQNFCLEYHTFQT